MGIAQNVSQDNAMLFQLRDDLRQPPRRLRTSSLIAYVVCKDRLNFRIVRFRHLQKLRNNPCGEGFTPPQPVEQCLSALWRATQSSDDSYVHWRIGRCCILLQPSFGRWDQQWVLGESG